MLNFLQMSLNNKNIIDKKNEQRYFIAEISYWNSQIYKIGEENHFAIKTKIIFLS